MFLVRLMAAAVTLGVLGCASPSSPRSGSSAAGFSILTFGFAGLDGVATVDQAHRTVGVRLPAGTDASALVAVFTTDGGSVTVNGVPQTSGQTPNDFRHPVTYSLGTGDSWTVTVFLPELALLVQGVNDNQVGYWKGNQYVAVGTGVAHQLVQRGEDVYVVGSCQGAPGYWKNGRWVELTTPLGAGEAYQLVADGDSLYVAGREVAAEGDYHAVWWRNGEHHQLTTVPVSLFIAGLVVDQGHVTVAASLLDTNQGHSGYWTDGTWVDLQVHGVQETGLLSRLVAQGGHLYAVGQFDQRAGYWKDGKWWYLEADVESNATDLTIDARGDVYVSGRLAADSSWAVGFWKNGVWTTLPGADGLQFFGAETLLVAGSQVSVAGNAWDNTALRERPALWADGLRLMNPNLDDDFESVALTWLY